MQLLEFGVGDKSIESVSRGGVAEFSCPVRLSSMKLVAVLCLLFAVALADDPATYFQERFEDGEPRVGLVIGSE